MGDHSSAVLWIEAGILAAAVIGNFVTVAYFAGRTSKSVEALAEQVKADREAARKEQDQQWQKINSTAEDVRFMQGQVTGAPNGRAKAHGAG